jgi:hypothetical protein
VSVRIIGALAAALVAGLAMAVMRWVGTITGNAFAIEKEVLSYAFVQGPGWLASAVAGGSILAAGLIGYRAARRAADGTVSSAVIAVLLMVGAYAAWVLVWTAARLAVAGTLASSPAQPFHAALLALSGLILPAIVLFLPAALLWAGAMRLMTKRFAAG